MMTPRTSLLVWTALLAVPALGWLTRAPGPAPATLLLVWAGVAMVDAWRSRRDMEDLRLVVPDIARWARRQDDRFTVRLFADLPRPRTIRLALAAPPELGVQDEFRQARLPADVGGVRLEWPVRPRERGRFRLERCRAETASRWGLWAVRRDLPLAVEVRVYPGLLSERRRAPALFMRRGFFGIRQQRRYGKGREFEQLRDYQSGDSLDDIHWKATAKRGRPITKMYQVERTQEVYVAVDASRLSGRPVAPDSRNDMPDPDNEHADTLIERYVNTALLLGRAAEMQGDLFGLISFSDRLLSFVRARRGLCHTRACLDAVCRLRTHPVAPDFGEVCSFIRHRLRRRALIVLMTQLDDPALEESLLRNVDLVRRQHLVLVCMPAPPVVRPLFGEPDAARAPDDIYAALAGHLRWRRLRNTADALRKKGVDFLLTPDDSLLTGMITRYLNIKQRQTL